MNHDDNSSTSTQMEQWGNMHLNSKAICCETNSWTMQSRSMYLIPTCLLCDFRTQPLICLWWFHSLHGYNGGAQCELWIQSAVTKVYRKEVQSHLSSFFLSTSNVDRLNHYIPVPDIDRIPYLFIVSFFFLFHFLIFCSIFFCCHFCRPCTRQIKKKTRHNRRNDGKNDIIAIKMCSTCLRGFAETFHN